MTSGPTQRRSKDVRSGATRDRLLVAARQVVARDGVTGATSRHITDAAGTNLASVTYHFGSKDALVAEALLQEVEALVEPALTALEGRAGAAERLLDAVRLLLEAFDVQQDRVPVFFEAAARELRAGPGPTGEIVARVRARLTAVIQSLQAEGALPAWVEPGAMAALVTAVAQGIAVQSGLDPDGPTAHEQAAQLAALLLAAQS